MIYHVPMPSLGADMDHGKIVEWKIHPGDEIKKGQSIALIETTKSIVEIESYSDGRVLDLVSQVGEDIAVGEIIANFDVKELPSFVKLGHKEEVERIKITPAARKLSEKYNVKLDRIKGTGQEGQIEIKDIEKFIVMDESEHKSGVEGVQLRETIARVMLKSKKEIPHYYLKNKVQLGNLLNWIDERNQNKSVEKRIMIPVAIYKAIILALKKFPKMNGHFIDGKFYPKSSINIGFAINLNDEGVMAPAILDSQDKDIFELNRAFQDLIERTRKGQLKNRELAEGTFTVTNIGDLGSDEVFGIIFPPQVAILGLGRIHQEAIVQGDGSIKADFVLNVTLSADHRVTDGIQGARFLNHIQSYLMEPNLIEGNHEETKH